MEIGGWQILIIIGVVVLLFGANAIPKLARNIGRAKKEFQKGLRDAVEEDEDEKPKKKKRRDDDDDDDEDEDEDEEKPRGKSKVDREL